jgi:hypothetical protein
MKVQLSEGPLDGTSVDVDEDSLIEGFPIYLELPSAEEPRSPGEGPPGEGGILEYLYEGSGVASYVAGLP